MPKMITMGVIALLASVFSTPVLAQDCSAAGTVGSAGSAAAGGTSASTVGTAGACQTDGGTTASIGSGSSAAAVDGKSKSQTKVNENPKQLRAQSRAQAMDKGTFSKSQTKTRVKGDELQSRTRSMSHVPGEKPVKSTTDSNVVLPQP
ncbi:hypothetical protein [Aliirhizobium cellulosilyticum]|uniref:Uncharacterized protein n=1 Tax=Aliirhizobium cellulosilyticum TaxID=393664 RepID=A0A7W6WS61_9HYPH|nr:hypothetical protein [Rhizobium cellulosilyticum]MBB4414272.1 hypothetical protein [Rhizobium cellulosilyticum]MBB4448888.1 hypothetical protein [Rhizobium cellulosilyticum]